MIGFLDCATGVSGDKFLAALIDAGWDAAELRAGIDALGLADVEIGIAETRRAGVRGLELIVRAPHDVAHRTWGDIRTLIAAAPLPETARERSLATFELIARAEARVHGVAPEEVRFHEVGAADSIVDVVGVALGMHALGIERLVASPVAVGSGTVVSAHGTLPVPAPATALLLEGVRLAGSDLAGELTTPTGAALLRVHASGYGAMPAMTLRAVGHGAGARELPQANVARLLLGDAGPAPEEGAQDVAVLESNLDHLSPEELAICAERLREAPALDVWMTPVVMKKGRPGVVLSALAAAADAPALAARFLALTGTLGVRVSPLRRFVAPRRAVTLATSMGEVRFKLSEIPGALAAVRAEADDVARIAAERDLPPAQVARALAAEARRILDA